MTNHGPDSVGVPAACAVAIIRFDGSDADRIPGRHHVCHLVGEPVAAPDVEYAVAGGESRLAAPSITRPLK